MKNLAKVGVPTLFTLFTHLNKFEQWAKRKFFCDDVCFCLAGVFFFLAGADQAIQLHEKFGKSWASHSVYTFYTFEQI
jgi:hypothetical protein